MQLTINGSRKEFVVAMIRLCKESLAGPLGYWERQDSLEALKRYEEELAELDR